MICNLQNCQLRQSLSDNQRSHGKLGGFAMSRLSGSPCKTIPFAPKCCKCCRHQTSHRIWQSLSLNSVRMWVNCSDLKTSSMKCWYKHAREIWNTSTADWLLFTSLQNQVQVCFLILATDFRSIRLYFSRWHILWGAAIFVSLGIRQDIAKVAPDKRKGRGMDWTPACMMSDVCLH